MRRTQIEEDFKNEHVPKNEDNPKEEDTVVSDFLWSCGICFFLMDTHLTPKKEFLCEEQL